jgi:hypothetical protein
MSPTLVTRGEDLARIMVRDETLKTHYRMLVMHVDADLDRDVSSMIAEWFVRRRLAAAGLQERDIQTALASLFAKVQVKMSHIRATFLGVLPEMTYRKCIANPRDPQQVTQLVESGRHLARLMTGDKQLRQTLQSYIRTVDQDIAVNVRQFFEEFCVRMSLDVRRLSAIEIERAFASFYQEAQPNGCFVKFADPADAGSVRGTILVWVTPLVTAVISPPWPVLVLCSLLFFLGWVLRNEGRSWFGRWVGGVIFTFLAIGGASVVHEMVRRQFQ